VQPFSWVDQPNPAVQAAVEQGVDRLLREVLGVVLATPTDLARVYGPLGINLFTLHLQGPMLHVIGQPYDPDNFWGADGQTADAIAAIPGGLPAALGVNTRVRVSTEVFVRSLHQRVERADVLRAATAGLDVFFHLQSSLPAIAAGGAWPNGLASRDALEPGFAVWLGEQLVLDGRASRAQVDDGNIVQIFNDIQAEDDEAFAYYAQLYLSTLTTDIWPLAGEVDGFSVTLSRPWVAPLTDEELVAVQPATGPGQHAAFRLRMAFDTAFGDGNFRFYIVPGVDPFLNFDATVLPATSSHAALWTQFVFEVIGDIVLLVLGVGDLFGLWDTGDTFGPFDALYPAGIPGHLLAQAVEPLGRDVAIGISARRSRQWDRVPSFEAPSLIRRTARSSDSIFRPTKTICVARTAGAAAGSRGTASSGRSRPSSTSRAAWWPSTWCPRIAG